MDKKERMSIARKFTEKVLKKYGPMIKSVVVFGSSARGDFKEDSDIDIVVIYDDTLYRIHEDELKRNMDFIAKSINDKLSIMFLWKLTEFWDMIRVGHPLMINVLQDGWAVHDIGLFIPLKIIFNEGKITPTLEMAERLEESLEEFENKMTNDIITNIYYATFNLLYALCIYKGLKTVGPKKMINYLKLFDFSKKGRETIKNILNFRERSIKDKKASIDKTLELIEDFKILKKELTDILEKEKKKKLSELKKKIKSLGKDVDDINDLTSLEKIYIDLITKNYS